MLLSRTADAIYWAGRYLERAESTARMIRVHTELYLDLPLSAGVGWSPLLATVGSAAEFEAVHGDPTEEQIVAYLSVDPANPGSVLSSLSAARTNFRVLRAVVPGSSWEELNALFLRVAETRSAAIDRRSRSGWMNRVVRDCEVLRGLLMDNMSHDEAYAFLEIGRLLERADMTTRVLDVQAGLLGVADDTAARPYEDVLWMAALRSLSAYQMFLRASRSGVSGPEALRFLLRDDQFPRSVEHCITQMSQALIELPRYEVPMAACARAQRELEGIDLVGLATAGLHEYADRLQIALGSIHEAVRSTYFGPRFTTDSILGASA